MNKSQLYNMLDTLKSVAQTFLREYFERTTIENSNNCDGMILTYFIGETPYKMLIKKPSSEDLILVLEMFYEKDNVIVSSDVKPFMGPYSNFYGIEITPKDLGYKSLTFNYIKNCQTTTKTFEENERIVL